MTSTCLLCYQDNQYFVLPPCNHKEICWKCCLKLIDGSIFSCPFCKDKPQVKSQLLFISNQRMEDKEYQVIMKNNPFRSNKNTYYFYENESVAKYIESETSFHCVHCGQVHQTINLLKKHLNNVHRLQFCDVCLDNRRCINIEQTLYSEVQLQVHLKQGDVSQTGQVILYHPGCEFCNKRYYDIAAFRLHLQTSSHLKCQICDLNSTKLRYVYYRNYDDLQRHQKKTHHVCDVGDCVGKKLENVFASEGLLEEHKRRCHRKYKGDKNQKVENILLGFNKTTEEDHIEFDGIGRNLQRQFAIFERNEKVDKQVHNDELIDIREFYPEMVKNNINIRIDEIIQKLDDLHRHYGTRTREVKFNDILLFKPLEMSPLSRAECQKLIKRCFSFREAEGIIEMFFTKRHEFTSFTDYFQAIEKKMKNTSIFAFYLVFPQMVRFMKDENKNKIPMDEHYGLKLRVLIVNRELLCHVFDRYSHFLKFLKKELENELIWRCENSTLDLDKYCKYMREMSINYYIQNQDELYFVPKEKCTNLYHMIERCRTKDFLKMNWLLKVGLPQQKYQHIMKNIYFKTKEQCCQKIFKPFIVKEVALIHLYVSICLQTLLEPHLFEVSKKNPKPHYLTDFLLTLPRPKTISAKLLDQLRSLEGHSNALEKKAKQRGGRAILIDEVDCPSLLKVDFQANPARRKPPDQQPELGIGKSRLPIWNEDESIRKKKGSTKPQQVKHDEEFPALATPIGQDRKETKDMRRPAEKIQQQEDFPIYNFKEKFVAPKKETESSFRMQDFLGFNNRTVTSNKWDENRTRQRFDQIQRQKEEAEKEQRQKIKQNSKKPKYTRQPSDDEDQYLRMAIEQSVKTAALQEIERNNKDSIKVQQFSASKQQFIVSKKKNEEQEPQKKKKKKYKAAQEKKQEKPYQEPAYLFQQIDRQVQQIRIKKQKAPKMRIDYSDSEEEKPTKEQQKPKTKYNNINFKDVIDTNQFMPIGGGGMGDSIITRIQNETSFVEVKNSKVVKNGKKGKKVIIEKVNIF